MAYIGQNADGNFTTSVSKDTFSGNGSTTAFTLSEAATTNTVDVFVENIRQEPTTAYSVDGTTLTFTAAPVSGTNNIYVVNRGPIQLSASHPAAQSLSAFSATITNDLTVDTSTLKVDSTNNRVGIGITSPSTDLHLFKATGDTGVTIQSSATANAKAFVDLYGRDASNVNQIWKIENDAHNLTINDDGTERMRIDSGGHVGIGETSPTSYFTGADNLVISDNSADSGLTIRSGTSSIGRIHFADGTSGSEQYRGFVAYSHSSDSLVFGTNGTGGTQAAILSGGGIAFNGDTAEANALDDYEEGTWTATTGTGTVTSNFTRYVKIGRQVTLFGYLTSFSDRSSSSGVAISGLPFTSGSDNYSTGAAFVRYLNVGGDSVTAYIPATSSTMSFYASRVNDNYLEVKHSHLSSTLSNMFFTITYQV